jgi:replicative DNA helicase
MNGDFAPPDPYEDEEVETETAAADGPPHSREAEEAVVGSVLINPDVLYDLELILKDQDFYIHKLGFVWAAFVRMRGRHVPIDMLTITEELSDMGRLDEIGGPAFLTALLNASPTSLHAEAYARIIKACSIRRELILRANQIATLAYDAKKSVDEVLAEYDRVTTMQIDTSTDTNIPAEVAALRLMERMMAARDDPQALAVPVYGMNPLQMALGGWPRKAVCLLYGDSSIGKCLGKGTKICMFDGSLRAVEDIQAGDLLMGPDSNPRKVKGVTTGEEMMYWVHQKQGISYRVNESHILSLKRSTNRGGHVNGEILNISVREWLRKDVYRIHYKGWKTSVEFQDKPVNIDPYLLGIWLGDGRTDGSRICNTDPEVIEYLEQEAERRGAVLTSYFGKEPRAGMYNISYGKTGGRKDEQDMTFSGQLRLLGLKGNKHIPNIYLCNSKEKRLRLLAGLIDSDGYYPKMQHGPYEIVQKSEKLARQIKYLVDSLGYRASITARMAQAQTGEPVQVWRVVFNGNVDEIPVLIPRKKAKPWTDFRDWTLTGIDVVQDKVDEYFGFTLDGDGLFLLEDMTVTHNTALALQIAEQTALQKLRVLYITLESNADAMVGRRVFGSLGIDGKFARSGVTDDATQERVEEAIRGYMSEYAGYLTFNEEAWTLPQIVQAIRHYGPDLVIVDHLGEMTAAENSRDNETQTLLKNLRGIKKAVKRANAACIVIHTMTDDALKIVRTRKSDDKAPPLEGSLGWARDLRYIMDMGLCMVESVEHKGGIPLLVYLWTMKDRESGNMKKVGMLYYKKEQVFKPAPQLL